MSTTLTIDTAGRGFVEITSTIDDVVRSSGLDSGLCHLHLLHTSAGLTIQENADPSARHDLEQWLERIAPEGDTAWTHVSEGPDDMPSHVKAMLTGVSLALPVRGGALALGTWQGVYLCEFRRRPHRRSIIVTLVQAA